MRDAVPRTHSQSGLVIASISSWVRRQTQSEYPIRASAGPMATSLRACLEANADFRSSAHVERLELMDLLAVKECRDTRFLPERYRSPLADVNACIERLKHAIGE